MREYPYPEYDGVRSIVLGIVLSILTLGIYYFYWQYKQMETLNAWLGREEYNFWLWLVLYILTCSIFELYYEYKMAKGINEIQENNSLRVNGDLALICVLISIFSLGLAATAIQQWEVNKFYGESADD